MWWTHCYKKTIYFKGVLSWQYLKKYKKLSLKNLEKTHQKLTLESTFDDLDADSLDLFQVISEIEDAFDIQIEAEDDLKTVGDLVAYVEEQTK